MQKRATVLLDISLPPGEAPVCDNDGGAAMTARCELGIEREMREGESEGPRVRPGARGRPYPPPGATVVAAIAHQPASSRSGARCPDSQAR